MAEPDKRIRGALIAAARRTVTEGLGRGTSGNLSVRVGSGFLITPTGMPYESLQPDDLTLVAPDGCWHGDRAPSSEWRLHRDLYARRPEAGAVLHTHSPFAVALACLRLDLPPFHYLVARFGGDSVRCAAYATYGTQQLSDAALAALEGRSGALLANHGAVVCADRLDRAFGLAVELEDLCAQFWRASQLGQPVLLSGTELAEAQAKFAGYGQPPRQG